jgi:hypothetical protein
MLDLEARYLFTYFGFCWVNPGYFRCSRAKSRAKSQHDKYQSSYESYTAFPHSKLMKNRRSWLKSGHPLLED